MNAIGIVSCVGFLCLLMTSGVAARWLDGRRSGWDRLGRRYPAGRAPWAGSAWTSVCVNGHWYRADVRIGGGGIRIGLPGVFRPYHRPLLLPWDDVEADDGHGAGFLAMDIGQVGKVTVTGSAADRAERVLARARQRNASSW